MGATKDQDLTIQRIFLKQWGICTLIQKDSTHEEPLIPLSIWIRNDAIMNGEDDEVEGSRRSLSTKQIKISTWIVFSYISSCLYDIS